MNESKNRGVQDILIAVVPAHGLQTNHCRVTDGLKGFPEAITAAFPQAAVQPGLCPFRAYFVEKFCLREALSADSISMWQVEVSRDDGIRQHLAPFYSSTGRPSVDAELMIYDPAVHV